jgi:tripartite-type tricarboxylate transporter receptor subunit TctC
MSARRRFIGAGIAAASLVAMRAWAAYPDRQPVKIIVPFAAGTGADLVGRAVADALAARMKVKVTVENLPGEAGATGTVAVKKAAADGHTLLLTSNPLTITPYRLKTSPYDPTKDLVAVAQIAAVPLVLVTSAKSPNKSFEALVAEMRQKPGKVAYATSGKGALNHLEVELIKRELKVDTRDAPQGGDEQALAATVGGKAGFMLANLPMAMAQINKGQLRPLAVSSSERMPAMPNVPTIAEAIRKPGYSASVWYGVLAPAGTPVAAITRLENEIQYELEVLAVQARIAAVGGKVAFLRSAPFGGQVRYEYAKWGQVVRALKLSI